MKIGGCKWGMGFGYGPGVGIWGPRTGVYTRVQGFEHEDRGLDTCTYTIKERITYNVLIWGKEHHVKLSN